MHVLDAPAGDQSVRDPARGLSRGRQGGDSHQRPGHRVARLSSARPNHLAQRLAIVRGFARCLQTIDPATEEPSAPTGDRHQTQPHTRRPWLVRHGFAHVARDVAHDVRSTRLRGYGVGTEALRGLMKATRPDDKKVDDGDGS